MSLRFYKAWLVASLVLNALLIAAIWFYSSIEGLLDIVEAAVGFVN